MSESLNFTIERLKLYFLRNQLRCELISKNMDLIAEDLNSLLDLSEITLGGGWSAFLASVNFIEPSG
jgi:hypothetical protein